MSKRDQCIYYSDAHPYHQPTLLPLCFALCEALTKQVGNDWWQLPGSAHLSLYDLV